MAISLPSKKILIADVPEVQNFNSKFEYNFFMPDEQSNESGNDQYKMIGNNDNIFDSKYIESKLFQSRIPRGIKFTWKPVIKVSDSDVVTKFLNNIKISETNSIKNNLNKLYKRLCDS